MTHEYNTHGKKYIAAFTDSLTILEENIISTVNSLRDDLIIV